MDAPKGLSRKRARQHRDEHVRARRDVAAVALLYGGTILWLLVIGGSDVDDLSAAEILFLLFGPVLAGAGAVGLLGPGALAATFAGRPRADGLLLAVPAAALMVAGGILLVYATAAALGESPGFAWSVPSVGLLVELAVVPALVEEWLCRGVLWTACARLTTTRRTIAATALLFAMLHVPAWGLLKLPDTVFAGLVLGALRARTGSLVPCALAHFLNNAVAAALGG